MINSMNSICRFEKFGLMVLACFLACSIAEGNSSVSLEWNPNTDPSVDGYNVYYGGASHDYTNVIPLGNTTNVRVDGLMEGKAYYFAVTARDAYGDESDFSDETAYLVPGFVTLTPGTIPGDPLRIQFPVAPAHWYELQESTDLQSWTTIWQTTGVTNTWVEFDAAVAPEGQQFFRVALH
jgi:hypothetical protein